MMNFGSQQRPKVVIVMGITGVGKSKFIRYATGLDVKVGHDQIACTERVASYAIADETTFLIDTPGFDDTFRNDGEILTEINDCLAGVFKQRWEIAGIIYVHPITDTKMKGSAMKNLRIFKAILGTRNLTNCILLTTKWSLQDRSISEMREKQLVESREFWKPLCEAGATTIRFGDSKESALEIVHRLTRKTPIVPQLTQETQVRGIPLPETSVGEVVDEGLRQAKEAHMKEIQQIKADQELARAEMDKRWEEDLRVERRKAEEALRQVEEQRQAIKRASAPWKAVKLVGAMTAGSVMMLGSIGATILTDGLAAGSIPVAYGAYMGLLNAAFEDD